MPSTAGCRVQRVDPVTVAQLRSITCNCKSLLGNESSGATGSHHSAAATPIPKRDVSIAFPPPSLISLLEFESLERELRLDDARRLDPRPEHVLLRGHVVWAADPVEGVEIVGGAVVELVLARPREAVLHPLVQPQAPHQLADLVRQLHLVPLARHLEEEPRVVLQRTKKKNEEGVRLLRCIIQILQGLTDDGRGKAFLLGTFRLPMG